MKFNLLLEGPTGTGKTTVLKTLVSPTAHLKQVRVLSTEPGIEALFGEKGKYPLPPELMTWHYLPPARPTWDVLKTNARMINTLNYEGLLKFQGNRQEYQQFYQLLETLAAFKDDRTGADLGAVDSWDDSVALAIDGLSGLSQMAMGLVVGSRPAKTQAEWGIAQELIFSLVSKLCADTKCSFVLISHVDRELNEVTGGSEVTVSTLGRKLAPRIPPIFDEVVLARRNGTTFQWSTAAANVDLKSRRLPISDDLKPDFGQLFK
jgi:AAA domain